MTMSAPASSRPLKRALLIGCALAALGTMAGQAHAQAFNATPTTAFGTVVYNRATPGVETVRVDTNTAVINWRPTGGTFLPTGNTATFTNGVNNADFVVLNRILSVTPAQFDGTVLSRLVNGAGQTTTGGTVIFSSPGGLIVGATGVFDVGSLVLTTLNVDVDAGGNFYDAATRGITLSTGPSPIGSPAVITLPGAQLNALQPNSYVALIGPVVQHGGATRVNGSAAYIAGEQVTFRANQGLFDIIVDVGSDVATPLTHSGSTGGPANTTAADNHAIYLVAMPKNQAITAVLQGDIGFDPAVSAGVENGVIVLSAGANIENGQVDRYGGSTGTPAPDQAANFDINGGIVHSDLIGVARTNMRARPSSTPTLTFEQDVSLFGGSLASISASTNQTVTVLGNALVSAAAFNTLTPGLLNLTGGQARIFTNDGGTIHIFGTATVDASARGLPGNVGSPGSGTGGRADVDAAGGSITIDGALAILATGQGGTSLDPQQIDGAAGTGGSALLTARQGGTVNANGTVSMDASGTASFSDVGATRDAAPGTGGIVQVLASSGGAITVGQAFSATADGFGGPDADFGGVFAGGDGTGGGIGIGAGVGTVTFTGSATLSASGSGGAGPTGGVGNGGTILVQAGIGTINFAGGASGTAGGSGGDSITSGVEGGAGFGGTIQVTALAGTGASRISGTAVNLSAPGQGGRGGNPLAGQTGGAGGLGIGGSVSVLAESGNGVIDLGAVQLAADGTGGDGGASDTNTGGGTGGIGNGGTVVLGTQATQNIPQTTGGATFASANLSARGIGGTGGFGRGTGGIGAGGTASVSATGAPVTVTGATDLSANGLAGAGGSSPSAGNGAAGSGEGGSVNLAVASSTFTGATGSASLAAVTGSASGIGASSTGNLAGEWHVGASGGGTLAAASLTLTATAQGTAPGAAPASSLDPQNSVITVSGTAALSTDGDILVSATQAGRLAGGEWDLVSGRDVILSHANPPAGGFTIDVDDLSVQAARDVTVNAGVVTRTSDDTDISAGRLATVAGRVLGDDIDVTAADLNVTNVGAIGDASSEDVDILVTNNAAVAGQILGQDILLSAGTIGVAATGQVGGAASNRTELRATGNTNVDGNVLGSAIFVTAGSLGVGGAGAVGNAATLSVNAQVAGNAAVSGRILGQDILLSAGTIGIGATGQVGSAASTRTELRSTGNTNVDGSVLGSTILVTAASLGVGTTGAVGDATTQSVNAQIAGNAAVSGQVLGRNILVNAGTVNIAGSGVVGGAATDLADLNAAGGIGVTGRVRGRSIRLASADVDIAAGGSVGDAATQLVTLVIAPSAQFAVLGGTTQGPGYTLTNAEAGRIRGDTLRVNAPALGANPGLIVRDLTLTGGGAATGIGLLDIVTPGVARVEGALLLTGARATDGIAIAATQRLEVVTPTASVRVRDAAGAPGGTLTLASNNIWVASDAIITLLRADPNYAGRDDDLIDNDGVDAPRGYLEGNAVQLTTRGTLFVQNTTAARGTFLTGADFGGVTTGAGGLRISALGPTPASVYAFGRRLNADGSFTTGDTFFFDSTYDAGGAPLTTGYTSIAAVNTCIIVTGQCRVRVPPDSGIDGKQPITGPTDGSTAILLPQNEQDDVIDSSFSADPLIEEPVTSGSEPGQWNCDPDHDGDCDDQPQ